MNVLNKKDMKQTIICLYYFILFSFSLSLGGCLSQESSTPSGGAVSTTADLGFSGITSAENQNGSTVKISWTAATNSSVTGYRIYEVLPDSSLVAVGQTTSAVTFYYHLGLAANTSHTYRVRAINASNQTDTNTVEKTAYTYSGITSATATGTTTATVSFPATGSNKSGVRVYATARGTTSLVATGLNTSTSANITGLKAGTTYTFSVKSYDFSNAEDTNITEASVQTTPTWIGRYQGPILVKAYGDAPGAPSGTPQTKQVSVTWAPFTSAVGTTAYTLVRVLRGNSIDLTTTTSCTSATDTSCRVCTATGSTAQTCIDTNVGAPPKVYDYMVTLNTNSWPEEAPASNNEYRITVPIPPDNMVLVHRDSANYEACTVMGRTPDPLNHQRCAISGASMIAATPYNTGPNKPPLNLPTGYYDFGYNVFFDRWEAGCNWTPQASGGMCGAGATAGNCFGTGTPANTIGVDGNIFYSTDASNCSIKVAGAWVITNASTLSSASRAATYTIQPSTSYRRPPLVAMTQPRAWETCQAIEDANYGKKRLPRNREWRAAAAWQTLTGEPEAITEGAAVTLENGNSGATTHTTLGYCNTSNHVSIAAAAFNTTELAGDTGDAVRSFVIGSSGTRNCVSRYGVQDMVGNVLEWTSDNLMLVDYANRIYNGIQSLSDNGNGYSAGFDMNGFNFDNTLGPNGMDSVNTCNANTGFAATTDPPGAGGGIGTVAKSTTNVCYSRRDASTWVTGASATAAELTTMHALSSWMYQIATLGGTTAATGWGAAYFNYAMGLPMMSSDNSNSPTVSTLSTKLHGDYIFVNFHQSISVRYLASGGNWGSGTTAGRWYSWWISSSTSTSSSTGIRCVLPAE